MSSPRRRGTQSFHLSPKASKFLNGVPAFAGTTGHALRLGWKRSNVSISVHQHARGCGLRADESEFARVGPVRKEAFALAQQDRADEEQNLIDQSLLEQHGRQRRASPDDEVRAILCLDAANTFNDV